MCSGYFVMYQWNRSTAMHTFLSTSPRTGMVDSLELEREFGATSTTRDLPLPRLEFFGIFLVST